MKSNLETEWEASRKTHRKRWRIILYTLIPLSIVGGIIFYNNRDLLNDESDATETVGVTWSDTALKDLK